MDLLAHREPDERPSAVGDEASDVGRIVEISPHDLPIPSDGYVDLFGDDDAADLEAPRPGAAQPPPVAPVAAAASYPPPPAEAVPLRRHPLLGRGTFLPEALVVVGFLALGILVAQVIYLVRAEPSPAAPARAASPAPPRPPAEAAGLPAQRSPPPEAAPVRGPTPEVIQPDGAPIDPEAPPEPSLVTWPGAG